GRGQGDAAPGPPAGAAGRREGRQHPHRGAGRDAAIEVETAAYFVASEALANVLKHAQATRVRVALTHRGSRSATTAGASCRTVAPSAGWRGSPTGCTRWAERSLWTRRLDVRARAVRQRHRRAGVPVEGPGGRTRRARGGAAGGGRRPGGDRPADRGGAGQPGRAGRRLGARVADPAGDRGAAAD